MRSFLVLCLVTFIAALPDSQAAPAPKRTDAKPAVINAGTEQSVRWLQERLVSCAHIAIDQDKKVAELAIVRQQKDLVPWLEKNFRIERIPDTKNIRVSFRDGNREEQAAIINLVVDDFLQTQVGSRRDSQTAGNKRATERLDEMLRRGMITAKERAKAEVKSKKDEEYVRKLPVLVEHAKAR